jgi:probable HAF family extracellular repeat protein
MLSTQRKKSKLPTPMYKLRIIDSLGGSYTYGRAINNVGQIVGDSYLAGDKQQHAFIFNKDTMTDIGHSLFGYNSVANAINNHGLVVGNSSTQFIPNEKKLHRAFSYDVNTKNVNELPTFGGDSSFANGVNDKGLIVGFSNTPEGHQHGFVVHNDQPSSLINLGTLGGLNSVATAINDTGLIVGYSSVNDTDTHAFIYENRQMFDMGTLGGSCSFAHAINDYGQIVGSAYDKHDHDHAFLYDADCRPCMKDLGTLGGLVSVANSINNQGQIVGYSFTKGDTDAHAFLYLNDRMIDLNRLLDSKTKKVGWVLNEALAINDQGTVVGIAYNNQADIPSCAFILSLDMNASISYVKFLTHLGISFTKKK